MVARCTPAVSGGAQAQMLVAFIGGFNRASGGPHRPHAERPQTRAGLLDGEPVGLHVSGTGDGAFSRAFRGPCSTLPHTHFQGPALSRGRQRHARHGGVIDMREFGGLRKIMPQTYRTSSSARWPWPGCFPFPVSGARNAILSAAHEASQATSSAAHGAPENVVPVGPPKPGEVYIHDSSRPKVEPKLLGLARPELFRVLLLDGQLHRAVDGVFIRFGRFHDISRT